MPVQQGCVESFIEWGKETQGVGAVGIITGIILWMAAIGSIPICSDYAKGTGM